MEKIVREKRPTLIGPAVPKLTYLGPFYFNFSAVVFKTVGRDLINMGKVASFIGIINVILLFITIRNMLGTKIAFISAFIYSISFLTVIYNRNYWPLTYTQFSVIGTYFCLDQILKGKKKYILLVSVPLVVGVQSEPTTFSLIPLVLLFMFVNKVKEYKKTCILLFILIISHASLVIFDFRHDHFLSNMLLDFFKGEHRAGNINILHLLETPKMVFLSFIRSLHIFGPPDVSLQIAPIGKYLQFRLSPIPAWFLFFSAGILIYFLISSLRNQKIQIISLHVLIVILGISFYNFFFPGYTFEWFVNCLFPAFAVIWTYSLIKIIKNKYILGLFLLVIFIMNLRSILSGGNSFGIQSKIDSVKWASEKIKKKDFELVSIGGWNQGGYRYLFERYGKIPAKSYQDGIFAGWMYPKNKITPTKKIVFISELEFKDKKFLKEYNLLKQKAKFRKKFDNVEVFIL